MGSLEEQIASFVDDEFSAQAAAQEFFALYGESDITKKLNEMKSIQLSIETVLKQKVRSNYGMFLQANDQINQVGVEMADLKHLIENTQKLIEDVRHNRLAESRAMRTNSLLPSLQYKLQEEARERRPTSVNFQPMESSVASKLPGWLTKASEELAKYIVEQQYGKAVQIVLKTRAYAEVVASSGSAASGGMAMTPEMNAAVSDILKSVNERSIHLADTIKKSLLNLPNSQLWGSAEQHKRLKLLISLGEFHMAADGFSLSKVIGIKKALRNVEFSGDTLQYTSELSRNFFTVLMEASSSFLQLFGDSCEKPAIMSLLLQWIHTQMGSYVEILARQIQLGINECAAVIIIQLRQIGNNLDQSSSARTAESVASVAAARRRKSMFIIQNKSMKDLKGTVSGGGGAGGFSAAASAAAASSSGGASSASDSDNDSNEEDDDFDAEVVVSVRPPLGAGGGGGRVSGPVASGAAAGSGGLGLYKKSNAIGRGSLSFAASCLDKAFTEARQMDSLQLQSSPSLVWILLPEIQRFVSSYAEEFIKEIGGQVRQDSWMPVTPQYYSVLLSSSHRPDKFSGQHTKAVASQVGQSYDWTTAVLNHFCDEVWVLIRAQDSEVSFAVEEDNAYSRSDVCEVEPTAVACIMRILLRYVVEIESMETKGLTAIQLNCFIATLEAIVNHLIPSLQRVTTECFYCEYGALQNHSPAQIFKILIPRLNKLIKEKQSEVESGVE